MQSPSRGRPRLILSIALSTRKRSTSLRSLRFSCSSVSPCSLCLAVLALSRFSAQRYNMPSDIPRASAICATVRLPRFLITPEFFGVILLLLRCHDSDSQSILALLGVREIGSTPLSAYHIFLVTCGMLVIPFGRLLANTFVGAPKVRGEAILPWNKE